MVARTDVQRVDRGAQLPGLDLDGHRLSRQQRFVGLHAIKERPAVVAGRIAIRSLMYLSVSFDHRYIDGAAAARFMGDLVALASDPTELMVRL